MPKTSLLVVVALTLQQVPGHLLAQRASPSRRFIVDSNWVPVQIDRPQTGTPGAENEGPNVLHFRNGHRLVVDLFEVDFLGQLPRPRRAPILLVGARGCYACDVEAQVYPIPADVSTYVYASRAAYSYPGTLSPGGDPTDTLPFYQGRLFIGRCLAERQAVAVWFEQQRDSSGRWHPDVYRLAVVGDSTVGGFLRPMPLLSHTIRAMQRGACFEVAGLDQAQF